MCDFTVTYANVIHFAHSNDFTEQTAAIQQAWIEYPYPQPTLHELSADLKNCLSQGPHSTTFDLSFYCTSHQLLTQRFIPLHRHATTDEYNRIIR